MIVGRNSSLSGDTPEGDYPLEAFKRTASPSDNVIVTPLLLLH